jgi:hypothetical protein
MARLPISVATRINTERAVANARRAMDVIFGDSRRLQGQTPGVGYPVSI